MKSLQIVNDAFASMEKADFERLEDLLSEDFRLIGPTPEPLMKKDFVGFCRALVRAIPDWTFDMTDVKESGDTVTGLMHITGTHTATLDLSDFGMSVYPASGVKLKPVEEPMKATVTGEKLSRIEITPVKGGGIEGLLKQISVGAEAHA